MNNIAIQIAFFSLILANQTNAQNQLKITSTAINFREEPRIAENIICLIPRSTTLYVNYANQQYNDWIKISYNGKVGYVYAKYLVNPEVKSVFSAKNQAFTNSGAGVKYYINSRGERVQSPTYYFSPPRGATAVCRDGTYSFSRSRRGTCSHHGGVKKWL